MAVRELGATAQLGVVHVAAAWHVHAHLEAERLLDLRYRVAEVYGEVAGATEEGVAAR